ncbi:phosphotransferase family protein [Leptospira wolffii]|uniref:Phosphotransferase family protein n=1 Tax=Leptospira wolffii TaxID=409998 RepID=A0ABV5BM78_9LEPT|nr:aminoglycoside phosphotransferase family protein [Leptospira wolffii]TGL50852.1 phosphotransferase [Leptospira wolffii]
MGQENIDFAISARTLAIGRSAEILDFENNRIMKLYFGHVPDREIETEYENSKVAFSSGATSMKCYEKIRYGERVGIVFDKIEGISLTKLPDKKPAAFFSLSKILADLHLGLHNKKAEKLKDVKTFAAEMLDLEPLSYLNREEKDKARKIILDLPDGNSLLHMDFHPENIIVAEDSFVVIDWMTALKGHPAADVASTQFLFQDAELWPGTPWLKIVFYNLVRKFLLKGYLKHYYSVSSVTPEEVKSWRLPILLLRLGLWNIDSERPSLQKEIRELISLSDRY